MINKSLTYQGEKQGGQGQGGYMLGKSLLPYDRQRLRQQE